MADQKKRQPKVKNMLDVKMDESNDDNHDDDHNQLLKQLYPEGGSAANQDLGEMFKRPKKEGGVATKKTQIDLINQASKSKIKTGAYDPKGRIEESYRPIRSYFKDSGGGEGVLIGRVNVRKHGDLLGVHLTDLKRNIGDDYNLYWGVRPLAENKIRFDDDGMAIVPVNTPTNFSYYAFAVQKFTISVIGKCRKSVFANGRVCSTLRGDVFYEDTQSQTKGGKHWLVGHHQMARYQETGAIDFFTLMRNVRTTQIGSQTQNSMQQQAQQEQMLQQQRIPAPDDKARPSSTGPASKIKKQPEK
jgi:hypothetical protein